MTDVTPEQALRFIGEALTIFVACIIVAITCVIMLPLAVAHIVYTNWKEHTL